MRWWCRDKRIFHEPSTKFCGLLALNLIYFFFVFIQLFVIVIFVVFSIHFFPSVSFSINNAKNYSFLANHHKTRIQNKQTKIKWDIDTTYTLDKKKLNMPWIVNDITRKHAEFYCDRLTNIVRHFIIPYEHILSFF